MTLSVKISRVIRGELSQHFLILFLKEHWQAAGKMEVQLLSQTSWDTLMQNRHPTRIKNVCLNHSKTFVSSLSTTVLNLRSPALQK